MLLIKFLVYLYLLTYKYIIMPGKGYKRKKGKVKQKGGRK